MNPVFPPKLDIGSHLRVVAPARSRAMVTDGNDNARIAEEHLAALGLSVSYGEHVDERDRYDSSSIASRVADLHAAFADPSVDAILTVIGGANSNELLPHQDSDRRLVATPARDGRGTHRRRQPVHPEPPAGDPLDAVAH